MLLGESGFFHISPIYETPIFTASKCFTALPFKASAEMGSTAGTASLPLLVPAYSHLVLRIPHTGDLACPRGEPSGYICPA